MISVISLLAKSFALRSPSGNVAPKLQGSLPSRIPREFELPGEDAIIRKEGDRLIIEVSPSRSLLAVLASLSSLSEDFPSIADPVPDPVDL